MIPHRVMESQTSLPGTSWSAGGYRCMVPAMSGLLRWARPCVVALLTLVLVLGINGFGGAIHSVHHLPAPATAHAHDAESHGHGAQDHNHGQPSPAPGGASDPSCPVAAAALHLAAAEVAALPALDAWPAEAELAASRRQDAPRQASREPGSGRAPPSVRSTAS